MFAQQGVFSCGRYVRDAFDASPYALTDVTCSLANVHLSAGARYDICFP